MISRDRSSWAVSTASVASDRYGIKSKGVVDLASQQLLSCVRQKQGCTGGHLDNAWRYLNKFGWVSDEMLFFKFFKKYLLVSPTRTAIHMKPVSEDAAQLRMTISAPCSVPFQIIVTTACSKWAPATHWTTKPTSCGKSSTMVQFKVRIDQLRDSSWL